MDSTRHFLEGEFEKRWWNVDSYMNIFGKHTTYPRPSHMWSWLGKYLFMIWHLPTWLPILEIVLGLFYSYVMDEGVFYGVLYYLLRDCSIVFSLGICTWFWSHGICTWFWLLEGELLEEGPFWWIILFFSLAWSRVQALEGVLMDYFTYFPCGLWLGDPAHWLRRILYGLFYIILIIYGWDGYSSLWLALSLEGVVELLSLPSATIGGVLFDSEDVLCHISNTLSDSRGYGRQIFLPN